MAGRDEYSSEIRHSVGYGDCTVEGATLSKQARPKGATACREGERLRHAVYADNSPIHYRYHTVFVGGRSPRSAVCFLIDTARGSRRSPRGGCHVRYAGRRSQLDESRFTRSGETIDPNNKSNRCGSKRPTWMSPIFFRWFSIRIGDARPVVSATIIPA